MNKEHKQVYDEVKDIVEAIQSVHRIALIQYTALVDDVLTGRVTDESTIEQIMDGLLGFCDSPECFALFRRLCRHILGRHPKLVKDYIECYRILYSEQSGKETQ